VAANGSVEIRLTWFEANPCLEPLAVTVNETDKCHSRVANMRRKACDVVEASLCSRIKDLVAAKSFQTCFVLLPVPFWNLHLTSGPILECPLNIPKRIAFGSAMLFIVTFETKR
jgi:hypothetical protein